jgi:hypothetical protein
MPGDIPLGFIDQVFFMDIGSAVRWDRVIFEFQVHQKYGIIKVCFIVLQWGN